MPDMVTLYRSACLILLSGNVYFIKRLLDKIDSACSDVYSTRGSVEKISVILGALKDDFDELKAEVKDEERDLRAMQTDIAVLKHQRGIA